MYAFPHFNFVPAEAVTKKTVDFDFFPVCTYAQSNFYLHIPLFWLWQIRVSDKFETITFFSTGLKSHLRTNHLAT